MKKLTIIVIDNETGEQHIFVKLAKSFDIRDDDPEDIDVTTFGSVGKSYLTKPGVFQVIWDPAELTVSIP